MFSIKQPVFFICIDWDKMISFTNKKEIAFDPITKFPPVQRDLSVVLDKQVTYQQVEELVKSLHLYSLENFQLFDVFENEKLGKDKKSLAFNFIFLDKEKTLTDKEIENMMNKIITVLENKLNAIIRRNA